MTDHDRPAGERIVDTIHEKWGTPPVGSYPGDALADAINGAIKIACDELRRDLTATKARISQHERAEADLESKLDLHQTRANRAELHLRQAEEANREMGAALIARDEALAVTKARLAEVEKRAAALQHAPDLYEEPIDGQQ